MGQHSPNEFVLSVISFHEQVLGAHNFINHARTNTDIVRGYSLLLATLQGFAVSPVLPYDAPAVAVFDNLREQEFVYQLWI
jgi:tRNA(fMet)-specific endonuclease VapC